MIFREQINGIDVEVSYSEENVRDIFYPFLEKITKLQKEKGRRILVMLSAPPGCGKTTLLHFLHKISLQDSKTTPVSIIGMDGFHRYQDYLLSHTTIRDNEELPMVKIKGAPVTFDLDRLTEFVKRVANGEQMGWPEYNRMTHNPKEDAVWVDGDIVLLEGNYLLLNEDGWRELSQYADLTVKITASEELLKERLVERQYKSGKTLEEAERFVAFSDLYNVRTCLNQSLPADIEWKVEQDNSFSALS